MKLFARNSKTINSMKSNFETIFDRNADKVMELNDSLLSIVSSVISTASSKMQIPGGGRGFAIYHLFRFPAQ